MKNDTHEKFHQQFTRAAGHTAVMTSENFTYVNFFRHILPAIQEVTPRKILDIGSGAGTVSLFLARLGYELTGVETSAHAVEASVVSMQELGLEGSVSFTRADFAEFPREDSFDVILCLEVIEHCVDDGLVLEKARSVLKHGGLLVLSTPLITAPLTKLGLTDRFDRSAGHLRRYGREQIIQKVTGAGFTVDRVTLAEGIVRNSLFVFEGFHFLKRLIRGSALTRAVTSIDDLSGRLFGFSDVIITARKA